MAPQLVHATVFVKSAARSSIAAPQLRQLNPDVFAAAPAGTGFRFFSCRSSKST